MVNDELLSVAARSQTATADVTWDLAPLVHLTPGGSVHHLLDEAEDQVAALTGFRGQVSSFDAGDLATFMSAVGEVSELLGRVQSYVELRDAAGSPHHEADGLREQVDGRVSDLEGELLFFQLEWAALPDEVAESLLGDPRVDFCRHHLRLARCQRRHLLSEAEERLLAETNSTGRDAWCALFGQLMSEVRVVLGDAALPLDEAKGRLASTDGSLRRAAAEGITAALAPGLGTRAFILDTLAQDKAIDDRRRGFDHWLASRNLENDVSDASVEALVTAVKQRYDLPQRWYRLKAQLLGIEQLHDYDRLAVVATAENLVSWEEACQLVVGAYAGFDGRLGDAAQRFFESRWIDAFMRPGKRADSFCAFTVPSANPYILLNFSRQPRDVLHLAHELGHGLHGVLAANNGVFHHAPPVPLAETAAVFGEMLILDRMLAEAGDPASRLALLAHSMDQTVSNVFMQVAMHDFEHAIHTLYQEQDDLSVADLGRLWLERQTEMFGDAVQVSEGYDSWWSLVSHLFVAPGYLYSYAYGQLVALAIYRRYREGGPEVAPRFLEVLSLGGSAIPEEIISPLDIDLADLGFWAQGLALIEAQLDDLEASAHATA